MAELFSCEIAFRWMSLDLADDSPTLVQVQLGAVRQQAIAWANVDPNIFCDMASLGYNELIYVNKTLSKDCRCLTPQIKESKIHLAKHSCAIDFLLQSQILPTK